MPVRQTKLVWICLLTAVVALGLALRLYGIRWGLPDALHPVYSYHPDESLQLFAAERLANGTVFPKHFIYGGTIYFALLNAVSHLAELLRGVLGGVDLLADTILLGRYLLVIVALVTIVLAYHVGRLLFSRAVGGLAALFLAIAPAHIVYAQCLRPDEIAVFLAVMVLYLSARILRSEPRHHKRDFVYLGLVLGVTAAFRFPLIVFAAAPVTAQLLASESTSWATRWRSLLDGRIAIMGVCMPVAYALASPQTFLFPEIFIEGLKVQWRYQSSPYLDAIGMGPGIYQYGWLMLHQALGYTLYALAALGLFYAAVKRTTADWLLFVMIVPYLAMTSFTSWVVVRYTLPLVPLLTILAARVTVECLRSSYVVRALSYTVLATAIGWTLCADIAYLRLEAGRNVRDVATAWIEQHIAGGSSIALVKAYVEDEFFNPVIPEGYKHHAFYLNEYVDGTQLFREDKYDYLVLNEATYKNMERLGASHPSMQARRFYESLMASRYRMIQEFKPLPTFLGVDFSGSFASGDYSIVNPGIRVYQRQ